MKVQKCMIDKQLTTESVQILRKHFPPTTSSMMVLPYLTERTANAFCNAVVNVLLDIPVLQCPPNADLSSQSKICPNCGQDNDRYGLPIYPFNKSTKVLNWCTKCLSTVEDITTVDVELPQADNV